uniref:TRP C-terminal domain-containing protein n=1 Tax=Amphimedon queenslandica TaxID=400682 RepID=A0A1X7UKW7_AMPQE
MARFWNMTGIEPSFTHFIASIYILCFTKLASISFKILRFNSENGNALFFYDAKQKYFENFHIAAGLFAILVLLLVILLPTLYIQFYPFKWFHKMLNCLHLRNQLLLSLGDVFTGPYKNGSEKTRADYRYFAGFYLFARVLCQNFIFLEATLTLRPALFTLLGAMILILRPFKITYQNISEFIVLLFLILLSAAYYVTEIQIFVSLVFSGVIFNTAIALIVYRLISIHNHYCKQYKGTPAPQMDREPDDDQLIIEDEWNPDRIENPQEYDEQHVPVVVSLEDHCNTQDTNAATYGSIRQDTLV